MEKDEEIAAILRNLHDMITDLDSARMKTRSITCPFLFDGAEIIDGINPQRSNSKLPEIIAQKDRFIGENEGMVSVWSLSDHARIRLNFCP
jgi:hypothetical protein